MPRPRIAAGVAAALSAVALLAGCASSVSGTPSGTGSAPLSGYAPLSSLPSTSSAPSGTATSPAAGFPTTAAALGALLVRGNASLTSAHVELSTDADGVSVTATGDETLADGKATALSIVEKIPSLGSLELRVIGADGYVKGLPGSGSSTKPWVHVTADSTSASLKAIYAALQSSQSFGSLESISLFLSAATDLTRGGSATIDGVPVARYSFVVDTTKLPATFPNKDTLIAGGVTRIPVEIDVDEQGRVRKGSDSVSVGGSKVNVTFELSNFDAAVTIVAPPASETTTS